MINKMLFSHEFIKVLQGIGEGNLEIWSYLLIGYALPLGRAAEEAQSSGTCSHCMLAEGKEANGNTGPCH